MLALQELFREAQRLVVAILIFRLLQHSPVEFVRKVFQTIEFRWSGGLQPAT
jgi:hypothetical protein